NEVVRRVAAIKMLANEAEAGIRIGGIVDRDFLSGADATALDRDQGVHVLPVHEIENFFLHPQTLTSLLQQNGRAELQAADLVCNAADARAGSWIFQHAMATRNAKALPAIAPAAKERAKGYTWAQIDADRNAAIAGVLAASGFGTPEQATLRGILETSVNIYARKRGEAGLWKECEGKQVLNGVARAAGFADALALTQAAYTLWANNAAAISPELAAFRTYLTGL
ncbi:MAG: hypothetical protein ACREMY_28400, partial [bacterium]